MPQILTNGCLTFFLSLIEKIYRTTIEDVDEEDEEEESTITLEEEYTLNPTPSNSSLHHENVTSSFKPTDTMDTSTTVEGFSKLIKAPPLFTDIVLLSVQIIYLQTPEKECL